MCMVLLVTAASCAHEPAWEPDPETQPTTTERTMESTTRETTTESTTEATTQAPTTTTTKPVTTKPAPVEAPTFSIEEVTTEAPTEPPLYKEIARYETKYNTSQKDRTTNVTLAASFINGVVLQPGDIFSFNETVGDRTKARGFKDAVVYNNGSKETGIGGGICQVSSTLFNAALLANLEIVERHNHSLKVGYTPNGRDATVFYGNQDFRFRNNSDYPVQISIYCAKGRLLIAINSYQPAPVVDIKLNVIKNSGSSFTLQRVANGQVNYTTKSIYKD